MRGSRPIITLALVVAVAGCGGNEDSEQHLAGTTAAQTTNAADTRRDEPPEDEQASARRPAGEEGLRVPAERARIVADESGLGRVLFDANGQVVYVFEIDGTNRSNCTSAECVKAWPPVLTQRQPTAGPGVDPELLGTIRRDDGRLQVTYDGRPLYFYEHEAPGEIKCHDVDLHGGLWWVVTPRGEPVD